MAAYGYSYVTDKGFSAFAREVEQGAWKDISIKKYDAEDRRPASSLAEAPRLVTLKLRLVWTIRDLDAALSVSAEQLGQLDVAWDGAQRALNLYIASEEEHEDPARRSAAGRLRGSLLVGGGTQQTGFTYDKEVDFGVQQVSRARKEPLIDDVKRIGLEPYLKRVEDTTNALAKALGREPGKKRAAPPSKRLREAMAACTSAFNAVHEDLDWLIEHTRPGKERASLEALRAPFLGLLERYPATSKDAGSAEQPTETEEGAEVPA